MNSESSIVDESGLDFSKNWSVHSQPNLEHFDNSLKKIRPKEIIGSVAMVLNSSYS